MDSQQLAKAAGDAMYSNDIACQDLGIELRSISPGRAEMTMTVRDTMLNGHDVCHGGFIFTLADSCFAYACNSHNQNTLAAGARIDFLAPGRAGDVLLARGEERALAGRTGIYDVTVSNQDGTEIALFRGNSHRIKGELVPQGENA
jgi:acyl-CoA thioesterase